SPRQLLEERRGPVPDHFLGIPVLEDDHDDLAEPRHGRPVGAPCRLARRETDREGGGNQRCEPDERRLRRDQADALLACSWSRGPTSTESHASGGLLTRRCVCVKRLAGPNGDSETRRRALVLDGGRATAPRVGP